jgi:F-type H+-transporting ATPase subunit b
LILAAGGLLNVNPGLLVWTLVTFLIVVLILRFTAWNRIIHSLDARADKIHKDIQQAENLKKEAENILATYNSKVQEAKDEALAIVNEAKSDANNLKIKATEDAKAEIHAEKEQSLKDIELSKLKALQEIQEEVIELSITIAGQIIEKQFTKDDYSSFVKSEIAKLKKLEV